MLIGDIYGFCSYINASNMRVIGSTIMILGSSRFCAFALNNSLQRLNSGGSGCLPLRCIYARFLRGKIVTVILISREISEN